MTNEEVDPWGDSGNNQETNQDTWDMNDSQGLTVDPVDPY